MGHKLRIAGWVGTGVLAGVLAATSLQTIAKSDNTADIPLEEMQQLSVVFEHIKKSYVEPVDEKKLIADAIAGMVSGLDPHSQYFDAKSFKEFNESTAGRFVGVGIEIAPEDGLIKVITPIEDSPAFRAGLKTNDLITRINSTPVRGLSVNEAVKMIRGEPGTQVRLTIFRKDENRTFPVTITREQIKVQSVKAKFIEPGYAWLRLTQFQETSLQDFTRKIDDLYKQDPHIKGIVLDLRNNPGGLLNVAVGISGVFLPDNATIVSTNGQLTESKSVYKATPRDYLRFGQTDPLASLPAGIKNVPIVVLINEGSASASEIVAGALQDYKRATIMGSQSYGKGSVQTIRQLSATTGMKITTARYYTPSGRSIQSVGVVPEVFVDDTAEGNPFAALRMREADLSNHLKAAGEKDNSAAFDEAAEIAREEALKKLEEESRKKTGQSIIPEFGSEKDFPLRQALNRLMGKPVAVSKTLSARKEDKTATESK